MECAPVKSLSFFCLTIYDFQKYIFKALILLWFTLVMLFATLQDQTTLIQVHTHQFMQHFEICSPTSAQVVAVIERA